MSKVKTLSQSEIKSIADKVYDELGPEVYDMDYVIGQIVNPFIGYCNRNKLSVSDRDKDHFIRCFNNDNVSNDKDLDPTQARNDIMNIILHAYAINHKYHNKYSKVFLQGAFKMADNLSGADDPMINTPGDDNNPKQNLENARSAIKGLISNFYSLYREHDRLWGKYLSDMPTEATPDLYRHPYRMAFVVNDKCIADGIKKYGMRIKLLGCVKGYTTDEMADQVEKLRQTKNPKINTMYYIRDAFDGKSKVSRYGIRYFPKND